MKAYQNNKGDDKGKTSPSKVSLKQSGEESTFQLVDNRPVALRQQQIQQMANQYIVQKKRGSSPADGSLASKEVSHRPVVQRILAGESKDKGGGQAYERYTARKKETEEALQKTPGTGAANEVHALVFSGTYGQIGSFTPPSESERSKDPKTDLSKVREGGKKVSESSKDGELYLIDKMENVLNKYWKAHARSLMRGHLEIEKSDWSPPPKKWIPNKKPLTDTIRIEIIGPKGTCTDCQRALKDWVKEKSLVFSKKEDEIKKELQTQCKEFVPGKGKAKGKLAVNQKKFADLWATGKPGSLNFSLVTRWTHSKQILTGMRMDSKRHQSHQYGEKSAKEKEGVKSSGGSTNHWKLKIT